MFKPIALVLLALTIAPPAIAHDSLENTSKASATSAETAVKLPFGLVITAIAVSSLPYIPPNTTNKSSDSNCQNPCESEHDEEAKPLKVSPETVIALKTPNS